MQTSVELTFLQFKLLHLETNNQVKLVAHTIVMLNYHSVVLIYLKVYTAMTTTLLYMSSRYN